MIAAQSANLDAAVLAQLPSLAFGVMLVVARVGSALLTGPGFGEADLPPSIRLSLGLLLAFLVYPLVQGQLPQEPDRIGTLVALVVIEVLIGAWLGFVARTIVMALAIAGGLISLMAGLSSVLQLDPAFGAQTTALQRMMNLASVALFFASGLYLYPLHAIVGSYELIPPHSGLDGAGAVQVVVTAVAGSFGLAVRLAAPFIVTSMLWQSAIGLLGRLVPSIHVHLVTPPAQILGGVVLFALGIGLIFSTWTGSVQTSLSLLPGL